MTPHPVRLVVSDDLGRSRLTVVFRLLLAIPHLVWFVIWAIAVVVVLAAVLNALKVVNKKLSDVKIVFTGAGASGIAAMRL